MLLFFKNVTNKVESINDYQNDKLVEALPIEDTPNSDDDSIEIQ